MTILFVAPLQVEVDGFTQGLHEQGYSSTLVQVGRIATQHFPALGITVARGGHGKTQFGVQTQHLLDHAPDVEAVVCVGAAGALAEDLALGDLVLATETVEHDYTERFSSHPLPRFAGNAALLSALQPLALHSLPFGVHFGIVASGDEDVSYPWLKHLGLSLALPATLASETYGLLTKALSERTPTAIVYATGAYNHEPFTERWVSRSNAQSSVLNVQ